MAAAPAPVPVKRADGRVVATPYAKQLAAKLKVDLSAIGGSGPNGRITAEDVERAAAGPKAAPVAAAAAAPAAPAAAAAAPAAVAAAAPAKAPAAAPAGELKGTTVPFTTLQKAVANNMLASLAVPEFRVSYSICVDKLEAMAKRLKPKGVTMTVLLAKACGVALAEHEVVNAACTPDGSGVRYNDHINVAIAVAMPDGGLITPVLADADQTDIYEMSRQWADLVKRARAKKLQPAEYNSGTFAISNLGMFGVDSFDAILPPGTGAIIAIAGSKPTVVATEDGMFGVKKIMRVRGAIDTRSDP